jgi:hypothetical protein
MFTDDNKGHSNPSYYLSIADHWVTGRTSSATVVGTLSENTALLPSHTTTWPIKSGKESRVSTVVVETQEEALTSTVRFSVNVTANKVFVDDSDPSESRWPGGTFNEGMGVLELVA